MKKIVFLFLTVLTLFAKEEVFVFNDNFVSEEQKVKLALVIDKKKFFRILPSIVNSINSYFIYKNVDYNLKVFDLNDSLNEITKDYKHVIYFTTDKNEVYKLKDYNASFYLPIFEANDFNETFENVDFGLLDFKQQIRKLFSFIPNADKAVVIHYPGSIPQKLLNYEYEQNVSLEVFDYPNIPYYKLKNNYVVFNTPPSKTALILAQLTYKNLDTKLQLSAQINYDPLIIAITQPQNTQKLVIANSILNVPKDLEDINLNLFSELKFNWLNFVINALVNKIYNIQTQQDEFFLNDFGLYIFNHQISYKTKLYQIINRGFKAIQ